MIRYSIILPLILSFAVSNVEGQGFLKAKDKIIVNDKGQKVMLRGMGLGGWMLQEGYMLRAGSIGQQYRIKEKIAELAGHEKTEKFYQDWLENFIRRTDIDSMASWGFNSVRIPMHYRLFTLPVDAEPVKGENTWLEKGFDMLDSLLSWCKVNKIYLILDLHAAPGGQGNDLNISDRDPSKPSLWQSEANQQKTIALWKKLAEHYANEPWIGGYDIINEPNWGFEDSMDRHGLKEKTNAPLRKLMMDITKTIRTVDKRHIIIIEGNGWGNNYKGVLPPWDDNMVLSFHKYWNNTTEASIRGQLDLREKYNIPLWLGESGENSDTWFTEAIHLAETHDIGWSWWPLKKMGYNNPLEIKIPRGYQRMLDYWAGKGPKPTEKEAQDALDELTQAVRCENNIYHRDVTDAMFRQVYSDEAIPFKKHVIQDSLTIPAVEYDLGREGVAWFDKDSSGTPGAKTQGNLGHVYRNDGVDIAAGQEGYHIFTIEDGEWLQYTVEVKTTGTYKIMIDSTGGGQVTFYDNGMRIDHPATGTQVSAGIHRIKLVVEKGGFLLYAIKFIKS
jgi:aryl-phospho-beta-D-glucosidase BglC (GH1 family)